MVYPLYEAKPGEKNCGSFPEPDTPTPTGTTGEEYTAVVREFVRKYVR